MITVKGNLERFFYLFTPYIGYGSIKEHESFLTCLREELQARGSSFVVVYHLEISRSPNVNDSNYLPEGSPAWKTNKRYIRLTIYRKGSISPGRRPRSERCS